MKFSSRLDRFGDEVFAALNNRRVALEAEGRTIYNLSVGTPDFEPYPHVVDAVAQAIQDPQMWKYSLRDLPELKQAVCDYYVRRFGVKGITPDMVCSVNGTQEGVGVFGLAMLDEGDTVLVPDPCYPVFEAGVKIAGGELAYYPLNAEHDFLPYVEGIDPAVADRAKYMIVSLPANPVGSVGTPELYAQIIDFAREHDLLIVHDNAYSDITFDGPRGGSFLQYPGALEVGVEFFSLSKSFNVTGARIGFLVGRPDVVAAFSKLRSQIDFGMYLPLQKAAIAALTGPLDEVEHQRLMYQERRDALCDGLEAIGWQRPNAHGSMFVWAKLPGGRVDSMAFCEELMERAGVIVTPGASFGPHGEGYVRMALVLPPEGLRAAVDAIEAAGIVG
ncbi:aminotransferase class I/II-fold pyridoxal phosphate-dependent enzyme [Collinsella sp. KGMB02528]|uniref:Aminotransferase n=1 Tax=Collinsella acetigenes TaxID=2713419 RepID=A0A7X9UCP2_9ACTN|nr:aminotransferase class I/II-fold pyridoxal phosphate-dependent enzyme [Collinsella acetigenes]NMF56018.1 aminotransferase class I/II-fold pyridoxal phosphate-dependent enzyme [Collinsella acetigenes]